MNDHVILCGLGELGFRTLERLRAFGEPVVVVDPEPTADFQARCAEWGVTLVQASARDPRALREAGVLVARAVIAVASDDMVNLGIALAAREENPDLRVVLRLFNQRLVQKVERELPNCRVLDVASLAAPIFAYAGLHADILHCVDVPGGRFLLRRWRGAQVPAGAKLIAIRRERTGTFGGGESLAFSFAARPEWDALPLAGPPGDNDEAFGFMHVADADVPDVAGARGATRRRFVSLWRRRARRFARAVAQDAMLLVFAIIGLMVMVGINVFHGGLGLDWLHSAYFVVTIMTTTGFGDISVKDASSGVIWFVITLMMMGSITMAVLSAYFTEKLLALRMGALFARQPVPQRGHFVIAGLGTVGFRIAEELVNGGHPCVALEREETSRLVERARRLGVPVVVAGDVFTALGDVNLEDARGVIAVTNDDAVNLEVALISQEASPHGTVVARIFDPHLAAHLERSFGIHLARSPSAIAAPAFAAAVASGELLDAFDLGDVLHCVGVVRIEPGHELVGRTFAELPGLEVLPLSWRPAGGEWTPEAPERPLEAGDAIVVATPRARWIAMGQLPVRLA